MTLHLARINYIHNDGHQKRRLICNQDVIMFTFAIMLVLTNSVFSIALSELLNKRQAKNSKTTPSQFIMWVGFFVV